MQLFNTQRLHIDEETIGTPIKATLSRPEALLERPSNHHLRRTMASKKSLFIGPTKSQTRYSQKHHFSSHY